MNMFHLLRMAKWARNPPSAKRVMLVLGVVAICLALFGLEYYGMLPEWMALERMPRRAPRF
jgi:hypothetical protein